MKHLTQGNKKGNLYLLPAAPKTFFSIRFRTAPFAVWLQRLEHHQEAVVSWLKSLIDCLHSNKYTSLCDSCQHEKADYPFLPLLLKLTAYLIKSIVICGDLPQFYHLINFNIMLV